MQYYKDVEHKMAEAAKTAKTDPDNLQKRIELLQSEIKSLQSENDHLKSKLAGSAADSIANQVKEIKGVKVLTSQVAEADMNALRNLGDQLKDKIKEGVIVLASAKDGKVNLIAMVTETAQKKGAHAGNLIKQIASLVGGGGGGRPNMAQAGGKNPQGIKDAMEKAEEELTNQLS